MPKDTSAVMYGKQTWKALVRLERFGYDMLEVFTDFVDFILSALLSWTDNMKYADTLERFSENELTGPYNDRFMQIIGKYKANQTRPVGQRPCDYMKEAWHQLQIETQQSQKDVIGHLYESQISLGWQGQFFTPHHLSRMMAEMLSKKRPGEERCEEWVQDPTCGSGRAFLLMAQHNLDHSYHFVGMDISPLMARMAAINMWLFNLDADIYQGNALSLEMSCVWKIRKGGWIWESTREGGKEDGTVAAWIAEYRKNHPPLEEQEKQAHIEEYERWQQMLEIIRAMEAQFAQCRAEADATLPEESTPVNEEQKKEFDGVTARESRNDPLHQERMEAVELIDVHQGSSKQKAAKKYTTRSAKKRATKERIQQKTAHLL